LDIVPNLQKLWLQLFSTLIFYSKKKIQQFLREKKVKNIFIFKIIVITNIKKEFKQKNENFFIILAKVTKLLLISNHKKSS
jgi:hypothetical protein